jgi:lysozyme family protein
MQHNFERSVRLVLQSEGGYVDHPRDPGGATNFGITLVTLSQWRGKPCTKADVKNLSVAEAKQIYRAKYWSTISADELPIAIDYAVFDYAVNSGPSRSAKALQFLVGATPDGVIGPKTLEAVNRYVERVGTQLTVQQLCDRRLSWLRTLPTWATFGRGWKNRVDKVRAEAIAMLSPNAAAGSPSQRVR